MSSWTGPRTSNFIFLVVFLLGTPFLAIAQKPKYEVVPFSDYCSLYLDKNLNKTFSSRALMFYSSVLRVDGGDSFLYSPTCNSGDYFAVVGDASNGWDEWSSFFRNLDKTEKRYVLEIKFEGKIGLANSYAFGHLGWARAELTTLRIISIRDVTGTSRGLEHNYGTATPLTDQISQLSKDSNNFLRSIWNDPWAPGRFESALLPTFVFIDKRGMAMTKAEYLAQTNPKIELQGAGPIATRHTFVRRIGNEQTELGTIEVTYDNGSKRRFDCEMIFRLVNNEWKLSLARMK